jgi:hypothetical protein
MFTANHYRKSFLQNPNAWISAQKQLGSRLNNTIAAMDFFFASRNNSIEGKESGSV